MKSFDEAELRRLLESYRIPGPPSLLVERTKLAMREEMAVPVTAAAPVSQDPGLVVLVGLGIVMTLSLFYVFTVSTILRFVLPADMIEMVRYSMYGLTAVGGCILAVTMILTGLRHYCMSNLRHACVFARM